MGVFSCSWFKCKVIIHVQFEGAKRYEQMENKQPRSTFLKYIVVSGQQPHRHYMPSTLLGTGETTQNSRPRSSHILATSRILTGKVRQCRLQLNYAVPCPSLAMEIGSHWRYFWGGQVDSLWFTMRLVPVEWMYLIQIKMKIILCLHGLIRNHYLFDSWKLIQSLTMRS